MDAKYAWFTLITISIAAGVLYWLGHHTAAIVASTAAVALLGWMMYTTYSEAKK